MMFEWMHDVDPVVALLRVTPCRFDLGDRWNDEAEMVERLGIARADAPSMKRQIVASRRKVRVVRVGLPYEFHPEHSPIEFARTLHIGNTEREMAKAAMSDQLDSPRSRYPRTA